MRHRLLWVVDQPWIFNIEKDNEDQLGVQPQTLSRLYKLLAHLRQQVHLDDDVLFGTRDVVIGVGLGDGSR